MDKKIIVISGVNLVDAGPISVYLDFLNAIVKDGYAEKYRVIALVGKRELFEQLSDYIELREYRQAKKSWINRLYLEYVGFNKLSKEMDVYIWISMHDTTPNVIAKHRFVYCHNPSPFNDMSIKDARFGVKYYLFSKFYKYLYKINIKKNDAVIVQQDWMRTEFKKMYNIENVIVARPSLPDISAIKDTKQEGSNIFVFPSFPRYYKNFQVACEAAKLLVLDGVENFKLYITLSGNENKYAQYLKEKYGEVENIEFIGLLPRNDLFDVFGKSSCLIFMSKLETWGMPITEYKVTKKPMIVADLAYAHETVGDYNNIDFVDANNAFQLSKSMLSVINGCNLKATNAKMIADPYAKNWDELCEKIFD